MERTSQLLLGLEALPAYYSYAVRPLLW